MASRPEQLIYALDERPPFPTLAILALQQVCIISIYLVIITIVAQASGAAPEVKQSMVSWGMIALAIGAALQALWRGPIGSGYLAPPVISAIYLQPSMLAIAAGGLSLLFGLTIVAGLFECFISRLFSLIRHLFPPVVSGLIVVAVGFELGLIGADQLLDVKGQIHSQNYLKHVCVSSATLILMISLTIWGRGILRLLSAMIGLLAGWLLAFSIGLVRPDHAQLVLNAPFFGLPHLDYVSYSLNLELLVPFLIAGLAAALRTIGVITTCQKINDSSWKRPDKEKIKKGIFADGFGAVIAGTFGVPGMSSSPSAVGISQFTLATSRYIAFAIAIWYLFFACLPKISALFITIPAAVVGGTLLYTGSMMLVSGLQIIVSHSLNIRKTFIVGLSLFFGLSHKMFPEYYQHLPGWIKMFTGTILSITTIISLILNALFQIKNRQSTQVVIDSLQNREALDAIIQKSVVKWGGDAELAKNSVHFLDILCQKIIDQGAASGPLHAKISYDDVKLQVELSYPGKLIDISNKISQGGEDAMLDEMPMAAGLSSFLEGIYPDQIQSSVHNGECRICFTFELF